MLSKLVDFNIKLDNKGAEWLLCILEEAQEAVRKNKRFSVRNYFVSLHMQEKEIKAAYAAISKSLKDAHYEGGIKEFIEECIS